MNRIDELFTRLDTWRHLPNYQLERRADIFFAAYLPQVLERYIGPMNGHIVPELPLKQATSNRSFKVDYVIGTRYNHELVLVELKTDMGSIRLDQLRYLVAAASQHPQDLMDGIVAIAKASRSKRKYERLRFVLSDLGVSVDTGTCQANASRVVLIQPTKELRKDARAIIDESGVRFDIIDFREFASVVAEQGDNLSARFAQSLISWAEHPRP